MVSFLGDEQRNQKKGIKMRTTQDLIQALQPILKNFLLDEESDGEVVVYMGLKATADGVLEEVPEPG